MQPRIGPIFDFVVTFAINCDLLLIARKFNEFKIIFINTCFLIVQLNVYRRELSVLFVDRNKCMYLSIFSAHNHFINNYYLMVLHKYGPVYDRSIHTPTLLNACFIHVFSVIAYILRTQYLWYSRTVNWYTQASRDAKTLWALSAICILSITYLEK